MIGATGTMGRLVLDELLANGARVRALVRTPTGSLPPEVEQVSANLGDEDGLRAALTALAPHDLTDVIPAALDVAIPRGSRTPTSTGVIAWHQFDRAAFNIGRDEIPIPGTDQTIGIYSPERSIADASGCGARSGTSWRRSR